MGVFFGLTNVEMRLGAKWSFKSGKLRRLHKPAWPIVMESLTAPMVR